MSVDPLGEMYSKWTPYAFAGNQVVHSRELEGLEPYNDLDRDEREDYNSENHGPGFGDAMTDQDHYQDAFPMGVELNEVVVGGLRDFDRSDESYGYDDGRYGGQEDFDNDGDGYSREDRDNNERAIEEMARTYQNIGTVLTVAGAFLSVTGIGAPIGMGLMAIGAAMSTTGISIDIVEDAFDGHDGFDWGSHAMDVGTAIVPELYGNYFDVRAVDDLMIGGDRLMIELGAAGSDVWMDYVIDLHK